MTSFINYCDRGLQKIYFMPLVDINNHELDLSEQSLGPIVEKLLFISGELLMWSSLTNEMMSFM